MGSQQFCLRWNNHQMNMLDVFDELYSSEELVDVTLACEGVSIKAHKVVLSACSSFFQEIFVNNPCKHPVVILKDMKVEELRAVLQFMYRGEVNVTQDQLPSLLKTAEALKVKGLAEMNSSQLDSINSSHQQHSSNPSEKSSPVVKSNSVKQNAFPDSKPKNSVDKKVNRDVLIDEVQENHVNGSPESGRRKIYGSANDVNCYPQLSALLDSSQLKIQPPSPLSDNADEDNYIIDHKFRPQNHFDKKRNNVDDDDDRMSEDRLPGRLSISDLSQNSGMMPEISISNQDGNHFPNQGIRDSNCSWYQQWRSKRKRYKRYTQETLETAISAVLQGSLSQKRAAVIYGIPHETLRRHVRDRKDLANGQSTIIFDTSQSNGFDENSRKDSENSETVISESGNSISITATLANSAD